MARAGSAGKKGGPSGQNRTAEEPGQTLNVDLCFVPAVHAAAVRIPVLAIGGVDGDRIEACLAAGAAGFAAIRYFER